VSILPLGSAKKINHHEQVTRLQIIYGKILYIFSQRASRLDTNTIFENKEETLGFQNNWVLKNLQG
jgi:hypothetical protein